MSKRNISNYAVAILLTFAITSFGLTYFIFPSYAAPTLTTFFSCETSDGCGYRYNTTLYLAPLPDNMTQLGNWTTNALIYQMSSNETITIDARTIQRNSTNSILEIFYTPTNNGSMGLHIVTDLNGQPSAESIEVELNASSLTSGNPVIFSGLVDRGSSTGGNIHIFHASAVGSGSVEVEALGVFSGIVPIHQHSGAAANMDKALIYDGSFSDVTAAFTSTGNDTAMFVSNSDSVYIGHASKYSEIQFNLDTLASGAGIKPTFEFSTGAGGWTLFNPIDATDGMRDDGGIDFEPDSLTGWATDTVSGFVNNFWVRINRTQGGLGTVPIEDLVQIVVGTEYIWDEDGNLQIFGMNVTDALRVTGISHFSDDLRIASGKSIVSNAGGFPDIVTFTYPTTINWNSTFGHSNIRLDGQINADGQNIIDINELAGLNNGALFIDSPLDTGSGNAIRIRVRNAADAAWLDVISIIGNTNNPTIDIQTWNIEGTQNILWETNNTGTIALNGGNRPAEINGVVGRFKSTVTGFMLEGDIKPHPDETFNEGDVVCGSVLPNIFQLCNSFNSDYVLGAVHMLQTINYNYDEFGNITGQYTTYEPTLIYAGPQRIKLCSPVTRGDILIGGENGCAISVESLEGVINYKGINIPRALYMSFKGFAIAHETTSGSYGLAYIRYN